VEGRSRLSEAVRVAKAEQIPPFPPLTAFQAPLFIGTDGRTRKAFLPNEAILGIGITAVSSVS
jgi:hypothetical protein